MGGSTWWRTENPTFLLLIGIGYLLFVGYYLYRFVTGSPVHLLEWVFVVIFGLFGVLFLLRAKYEAKG